MMTKLFSSTRILAFLAAFALTGACGGAGKDDTKAQKTAGKDAKKPDAKDKKPDAGDKTDKAGKTDKEPDKTADNTTKPPAEDPNDPATKVARAVVIANAIEADPEHADDILAKHELDRAGFEALMFEIAADAELANAYALARTEGEGEAAAG